MTDKKELRVGMIGYGFMARTHTNAYKRVNDFFPDIDYRPVLKTVCARTEEKVRDFAVQWGYESIETDWKDIIARDDIDIVDICTPNNMHAYIAIAAAEAGKMVVLEKPLARNIEEGEAMVEAVEKADIPNFVSFNYRRIPAITLMKNVIDSGRLGRIFHIRTNFLQDFTISPDVPQGGRDLWRLDQEVAGSGVTGDLLAHCIDTAMWLNGNIKDVSAVTETFVKERVHQESGEKQAVTIDDACIFNCHFENGSLGVFEASRYARGHKAQYTLEINGENGSFRWDLHDMNRLEFFNYNDDAELRGWRSIHVTEEEHPYMDKWWVPGLSIGFEHTFIHQMADFFKSLESDETCSPTFKEAQQTQKVCEAVLSSAKSGDWQKTGLV